MNGNLLSVSFGHSNLRRTPIVKFNLPADHGAMIRKFEAAMAKMAILGQDRRRLIDCSEVYPTAFFC